MPESKKKIATTLLKTAGWLLCGIVGLVFLTLVSLYLPFVQDIVFPKVLKAVSSEEMGLKAEKVRLSFPLTLNVEEFVMTQKGDTAVVLDRAEVRVNPLGLLLGKVSVSDIEAENARYALGNQDSVMILRAKLGFLKGDASVRLSPLAVDLGELDAKGIDVRMIIRKDTVPPVNKDSVSSTNLLIRAHRISLEDVAFSMSMEGSIDSLGAKIRLASLADGTVDLKTQNIYADRLTIDSLSAAYIIPLITAPAPRDSVSSDSVPAPSLPWTVRAGQIRINSSDALYAVAGARPQPGLDLSYISAGDIDIAVDSFYNRGTEIRVPITRIHAVERCGMEVSLSGIYSMDSTVMRAENIMLSTTFSTVTMNAEMGMGNLASDPDIPLSADLSADISPEDLRLCFPSFAPLLRNLPVTTVLRARIDAAGSMKKMKVDSLQVALTGIANLDAVGEFSDLNDFNSISGDMKLTGKIRDGKRIKSSLTAAKLGQTVNIPNLSLYGNLKANRGTFSTDLKAYTDSGKIALDGVLNIRREFYDADLNLDRFPVQAFLPTLGVGRISADIQAKGSHFNPLEKGAFLSATANVGSASYLNREYRDINLQADIDGGRLDANLNSPNRYARFNINAAGTVSPEPIDLHVSGNIENLDLYALGIMTGESYIRTDFDIDAVVNMKLSHIGVNADIASLEAKLDSATTVSTKDISLTFRTDSLTEATMSNGDMKLVFSSPSPLDTLTRRFTAGIDTLSGNYRARRANLPAVRNALPEFKLTLDAGNRNILGNYLSSKDIAFKSLNLTAGRDSILNLNGKIVRLTSGKTRLDTIRLDIHQIEQYLIFDARLDNTKGTMDNFAHVDASGYIVNSKAGIFLRQSDISGKVGYKFGATAEIADSIVRVSLVPYNPVIGYKDWTINPDNFIRFNLAEKHLDANLTMKSSESSISVFTEHNDSINHQEDINIDIRNIKIQEWISLNPFAPQMKGDFNADLRLSADHGQITGAGTVGLNEFYYGGKRVGNFDLDVSVTTDRFKKLRADVSVMVDSVKTITAYGHLNDSTSENPFLLDFRMIHFPLSVVNPFLPPNTGTMHGMLNGQMDITGEMTSPVFNGFLDFDSTSFYIDMIGSTLKFSQTKIPVDSNVVSFDNFTITAANKNPLLINGTVDLRNMIHPLIDLNLNAENMQLVNTSRPPKKADMFGKAFIDLDATAKGEMSNLNIDASLKLLSGTNVTYIIPDATNAIQSKANSEMVRFVNFADSAEVVKSDTVPTNESNINLSALLTIEEGTNITIELSAGSKDKIKIQPSGNLDFSMSSLNPSRLQGRININGGSVSYTPPFMSEKLFNFNEGSYIAFNGEMMNPVLNINAVDRLRANVTQTGQNSRLITFNILLNVTGTLNRMNVSFDVSTNDDLTVSNELASMSPEQRANQAMNLLLYNIYTGPGTKGNANIGGNALYSFLESQVNTWAANNIRGVDLSFGIDQYDQTTNGATSKTTSYSYRISKTLFNDRFKIVVGGAYTDDNDPNQNVALNLINDISLEYMLNKSGTMVIKIFRHTGYESILEGEITQTGVGFVYKRKIDRLIDLFKPFRRNKKPVLPNPGDNTQ